MKDIPNKMNGNSLDISAENRARLKSLFPTVFTETVNNKGELVESVDFEKLKAEIGTFTDVFENRRERYGMDWPGKKDALRLIQTPSAATLKPCRDESVNFDTTENLFIEGDNLEALKLLQKSYYGKVKMIYIDPPYNTGREFIYPDNFSESLETYLEYAGLIDGDGKKFSTNTANEGRFHTKWLNMMYPRLYLARNLLRNDGAIFISIDENEYSNLIIVCNEIFGETNYVGTVVWKNATDNNPTNIATEHEYLIVLAKNKESLESEWKSSISDVKDLLVKIGDELTAKYKGAVLEKKYQEWFRDNKNQLSPLDRYKYIDADGVYTGSQSVHNPGREGYRYDIIHPVTGKPCKQPLMGYRFPKETMDNLLSTGHILFGEDESKIVELKVYASAFQEKLSSVFELDGRLGAYDLKEDFPDLTKAFTNPKPKRLLLEFLPFLLKSEDDLVLDFFAGSATTAAAILNLNKKDHIRRRFILIQLPEPCAENSEAFKAGYKTIADIGKERIRRVIKKLNAEEAGQLALKNPVKQDRGFKVLKLNKSNFKQWQCFASDAKPEHLVKQLSFHIDHIDHKATQEDLLYEILIKAGFKPTENVEVLELKDGKLSRGGAEAQRKETGKSMATEKGSIEKAALSSSDSSSTPPASPRETIFSIADGGLLICLADAVTKELINAVVEAEPMQFICLDKAFGGNDQLKANAVQTFNAHNMDKEKHNQILFRTV